MSALLIEWLNRDLHLDRRVTSVEKDLSNGYLLGQVLRELEVDLSFPAGYVDNDTVAAMVGNMEQLSIALRSHGIAFTVDIARGIMMEKKGAATKVCLAWMPSSLTAVFVAAWQVLMDLHTHMEKRKTKAKHVVPSTLSVRPPANGNRHFPPTDPHVRCWKLCECDAVQSTREATELQFELSLREKRRLVVVQQNDRAAADLHDGVAGFEKNFKRLGISTGDEDSNARLAPIQGTGLEHVATLETRVEACQFRPASNVQMMKELRERRKVHLSAHKERASRRRKMLVDQTRNTIEV
ncbi:hypothetical protein DYB32_001028 [Aphanomyces invadans]|uniref:CH-like domain-containing protein n=1 Tax=Aphanomyces invadans TaxID=157072 RepID=A0A3R6ZA13_9STRA|nr:hypothetical protein DYB32_001028 [Aphanomyces invadans]